MEPESLFTRLTDRNFLTSIATCIAAWAGAITIFNSKVATPDQKIQAFVGAITATTVITTSFNHTNTQKHVATITAEAQKAVAISQQTIATPAITAISTVDGKGFPIQSQLKAGLTQTQIDNTILPQFSHAPIKPENVEVQDATNAG